MKPNADTPLFDLVTQAQTLASSLHDGGLTINAEIIRELCRRVVPVKVVPTRGKPIAFTPVPMPAVNGKVWCSQCESMVAKRCQSLLCKGPN